MLSLKLSTSLSTRFVNSYFEKGYYAMYSKKFITTKMFEHKRTHYWLTVVLNPYIDVLKVDI